LAKIQTFKKDKPPAPQFTIAIVQEGFPYLLLAGTGPVPTPTDLLKTELATAVRQFLSFHWGMIIHDITILAD